jgi:hypothetical protein
VCSLSQHPPGLAFGAIVDGDVKHEIWQHLGSSAIAVGNSVFDARKFAARLGLISATAEPIPFPLLESEGT